MWYSLAHYLIILYLACSSVQSCCKIAEYKIIYCIRYDNGFLWGSGVTQVILSRLYTHGCFTLMTMIFRTRHAWMLTCSDLGSPYNVLSDLHGCEINITGVCLRGEGGGGGGGWGDTPCDINMYTAMHVYYSYEAMISCWEIEVKITGTPAWIHILYHPILDTQPTCIHGRPRGGGEVDNSKRSPSPPL